MENSRFFMPDFATLLSAAQIKESFGIDYNGDGWYIKKDSVFLIMPHPMRREAKPDEPVHYVAAYQGRNPANAFNEIVNAPVRMDER